MEQPLEFNLSARQNGLSICATFAFLEAELCSKKKVCVGLSIIIRRCPLPPPATSLFSVTDMLIDYPHVMLSCGWPRYIYTILPSSPFPFLITKSERERRTMLKTFVSTTTTPHLPHLHHLLTIRNSSKPSATPLNLIRRGYRI